jgi:hypothetical protein
MRVGSPFRSALDRFVAAVLVELRSGDSPCAVPERFRLYSNYWFAVTGRKRSATDQAVKQGPGSPFTEIGYRVEDHSGSS